MNQAQRTVGAIRRAVKLAGVLVVVVVGGAGYSPSTQAGVGEGSDGNASVTIRTFQFRPTPVEVRAGTRVTRTNQDDILHTITSGTPKVVTFGSRSRWMARAPQPL
jgi:plastocyanin